MKKLLVICLGVASVAVISCKKSSSSSISGTIVAKWTFVDAVQWVTPTGSSTSKDTSFFSPTANADFRADGKVYAYQPDNGPSNAYDTLTYVVKGNQLILTDLTFGGGPDTMTIQSQNDHNLVLFQKFTDPSGVEQDWTYLSR